MSCLIYYIFAVNLSLITGFMYGTHMVTGTMDFGGHIGSVSYALIGCN